MQTVLGAAAVVASGVVAVEALSFIRAAYEWNSDWGFAVNKNDPVLDEAKKRSEEHGLYFAAERLYDPCPEMHNVDYKLQSAAKKAVAYLSRKPLIDAMRE
jgi:hypothetical protein